MKFRGGEFSTGTTGNFQPELIRSQIGRTTLVPPASVGPHRGRLDLNRHTPGCLTEITSQWPRMAQNNLNG